MRASCADGPCAAAPARSLLTPWAPQPCVCAAGSMHAVRWRGSRCLGVGGGARQQNLAAEPWWQLKQYLYPSMWGGKSCDFPDTRGAVRAGRLLSLRPSPPLP